MKPLLFVSLLAALAGAAPAVQAEMPRLELTAGMYRIDAEVAADQQNRMVGLMHRKSMPQHQGMLFVFTQQNTHCMWMRNTLLPLSVAFLDDKAWSSTSRTCSRRPRTATAPGARHASRWK